MGKDGDLIDLNGLTLVHRDTSSRSLRADRHPDAFEAVKPALHRSWSVPVKRTGLPCSCAQPRISRFTPDLCLQCGGNASKLFDESSMGRLRRIDPQTYKRQLLAMGIPETTIDRALAQDAERQGK